MQTVRGLVLAFGVFAASFALHILGGATDQGWLFAAAVVLIYVSASGFGVIGWLLAGARGNDWLTPAIGAAVALVLTTSALRAANDRVLEWWQVPLAMVLVVITSAVLYGAWQAWRRWRTEPRGAATEGSR